jgi:hypothetical protein
MMTDVLSDLLRWLVALLDRRRQRRPYGSRGRGPNLDAAQCASACSPNWTHVFAATSRQHSLRPVATRRHLGAQPI